MVFDSQSAPVSFAVQEIADALASQNLQRVAECEDPADCKVLAFVVDTALEAESYRLEENATGLRVLGGDARGLMYAGLEVAEKLRMGKSWETIAQGKGKPYLPHRGLRFNIPLDARTPSYDDTGDAAQRNIETMWDLDFWHHYLDEMARNRYNLLTFWNLHPYPSWVKVPEYPEVALDDVCVFTGKIDHTITRDWTGRGIQHPDSLRVIKKISIDEKIAFWQQVFQYAEDRGIDIYLFHWNVYVNGAEGKHGIEWKQDSPVTVDYLRKSVKAMLLTYPTIRGIGVTAGEYIDRNLKGKYATENWMWLTYGQGIMDARAENPDIDVRFIFRRHWSDLDAIMEAFKDYEGPFETSFKYSRARMYSATKPPWFDRIYRETVKDYGIKCWLNMRNDDIFTFRWGDPEYAQQYIHNMPYDLMPGFYMGPDGYVWGREFVSKHPRSPRQWEVDKHAYRFMIWGRTAYDPDLPVTFYQDQLKLRFPAADPVLLYKTWKATSAIISWTDKVHFRQNDFQFSPEGCMDINGFHDVNDFIAYGSMPDQGVASIAAYAVKGEQAQELSPFEVADKLDSAATILLNGATQLAMGSDPEGTETLGDFVALGHLGHYYAHKIRGATWLALYRHGGDPENQRKAIEALESSVETWKSYATTASSLYEPQLYARTRLLDWHALADSTLIDVRIAREAQPGQPVEIRDNNRLWEKDKTRF